MQEPVPYCAYLIRLWPTRRGGAAGCRVAMQSVTTGERQEFPDLEGLLAFLRAQVGEGKGNRGPGAESGLQA
jgi:hypothetical protein